MSENALMLYKVIPRWNEPDFETENWDMAFEVATKWSVPTVQCWSNGIHIATYDLNGDEVHSLNPDKSELTRKLTVRMSIEQIAWLTKLEAATGMNKSQLTRLGLTLLAAFVGQESIPATLPQGNPDRTLPPDNQIETSNHALVTFLCEDFRAGSTRLTALRVLQGGLKARGE